MLCKLFCSLLLFNIMLLRLIPVVSYKFNSFFLLYSTPQYDYVTKYQLYN